ncbi:MAG TPA: response regulator transcription factor [Pyrinomonadaceae bacterium]|nr:response regulator transcription factor [Pyrinomonadaceae bacterium]
MKILVADDDATTRRKLEFIVARFGWQVIPVSDGTQALARLTEEDPPKVALLDVVMPAMSGVEVCRQLRRRHDEVPPYLIMLTVRGDKQDILEGLEAGANDYLIKPFDTDELCARLNVGKHTIQLQQSLVDRIRELEEALARISQLQGLLTHDTNIYEFGSFRLEAAECRLLRNGTSVPLAAKVFDLLLFLVQNKGHLITKEELMACVWRGRLVEDNNLTVAMSVLRKVLDESAATPYVETIPKRGYRFVANVSVKSARVLEKRADFG